MANTRYADCVEFMIKIASNAPDNSQEICVWHFIDLVWPGRVLFTTRLLIKIINISLVVLYESFDVFSR